MQATQVLDLALPWLLESEAQAEDILVVYFGLWHHDQTSYWCAAFVHAMQLLIQSSAGCCAVTLCP